MARIAGVNIPTNKRVVIALQYIHGIGSSKAQEIVTKVNIPAERRVNQLTDAEVLAIRDAAAAIGDGWRLEGATVVVTVEPCPMCAGAILASRAARVVFGAASPEAGSMGSLYHLGADPRLNHEVETVPGVLAAEATALLAGFFAGKR